MVKWILSPWDWLHPSQNPNDAHILHKWCSECPHIPDSTSKKLARHKSCSNGVQAACTQKSILAEPVRLEQCLDQVQPTSLTKSGHFGLLRSALQRDDPGILEHWGTTWGMKRCFTQWSSPAVQRCARPGTWHKEVVMQAEARTGLGILASELPNFFATVLLGNGFTFWAADLSISPNHCHLSRCNRPLRYQQ